MSENSLFYQREIPIKCSDSLKLKSFEYCEGYKDFIDNAKTEREAVEYTKAIAEQSGFSPMPAGSLSIGDKIYYVNNNKSVFYARIGSESLENGVRIVIAHVDSPRLDLKQVPMFEAGGISYFKTHYYGGIKKYQWTSLPLSLHGVIYRQDGEKIDVCIGEDENDPVFFITDLMPHIAKEQLEKKLSDAISGETLNIINGSIPFDDEKSSVKHNILTILNEKYQITERDLITSELCATPAQRSRDVGFDRSMIAAYGQDDRICAYPAFTALIDSDDTDKTCIVVLADKEEIGSIGITGMASKALEFFIRKLCQKTSADYITCIENSLCLSADVGGAFDPSFSDAYEANNSAYINSGVVIVKYAGARGKSGTNDASAETVSMVTRIFDSHGVTWQTGEYGKVDQGGAGTVSSDIAAMSIPVIDCGVPVLSMHSPFELSAKSDIYMMHLACKAFFA